MEGTLSILFERQYILTEEVVVETRYRTETSTDPETGETTSEQVPYDYYIPLAQFAFHTIPGTFCVLLQGLNRSCSENL